jgi:hypothetical protein
VSETETLWTGSPRQASKSPVKPVVKIEKITLHRMPGAETAVFMAALLRFLGSREHVRFTAIRSE